MRHTFRREEVLRLIAISRAAGRHHVPESWRGASGVPGLILKVGRDVCLESNDRHQHRDADGNPLAAHATEGISDVMQGDERADLTEFITLEEADAWVADSKTGLLVIHLTEDSLLLTSDVARPEEARSEP